MNVVNKIERARQLVDEANELIQSATAEAIILTTSVEVAEELVFLRSGMRGQAERIASALEKIAQECWESD